MLRIGFYRLNHGIEGDHLSIVHEMLFEERIPSRKKVKSKKEKLNYVQFN